MASILTGRSAAQTKQSDLIVTMYVATDNLGRDINFGGVFKCPRT